MTRQVLKLASVPSCNPYPISHAAVLPPPYDASKMITPLDAPATLESVARKEGSKVDPNERY